jgi:hypothetical protein
MRVLYQVEKRGDAIRESRSCRISRYPPSQAHQRRWVIGVRFNERFLRRMADRVAIAQGEWARPEVALDPRLAKTQRENAQWAQECLAATAPQEPDYWDLTLVSIARIEELPRFTSGAARRLP